jgi:hypothetical protein
MNTVQTPQQASMHTDYPGNIQAGYEFQMSDPAITNIPDQNMFASDPRFHENLAHYLNEGDLQRIGSELTDAIDNDDSGRQKWLRVITDGIDYLGIGGDRAKSVYTAKSSDIFAPTLLKATLHAAAEIYTNIFPASGFAETEVLGIISEDVEQHAARVKDQFNYILTDVMTGYKADKKQGFLWMILEGSVFSKIYIDRLKDKPSAPYIRASDVIIDAGATSLDDAERVSHYYPLSARALEERFKRGDWHRCHIEIEDLQSSPVQKKVDAKVGILPTMDETNKYHAFYETMTYLDIRGFEHLNPDGTYSGRLLPYIVTKDKNSSSIVAIYRNYNENDPLFKPKKYMVQHKYFTGFNSYGFGLFHLCLGLAKAETEIQQQLIKAAQLSNAPSLLQQSGLRGEKTQIDIKPGSINQFQTFDNNIQNSIMPLPFKEPSQVLMQLREVISSAITDLSVAREIKPEDISGNMPAGSMLGILSTMHVLENSLLNDLFDSFRVEFQLIYNILGEWLPEEGYPYNAPGQQGVIMKQDFSPNIAIKPVLDPNVSSRAYKLIIGEALMTLATQAPDLYDIREVHHRLLTSMQVPDIDQILKPKQEEAPPPAEQDPISENKAVMEGSPVKAYKTQDHTSHITVHQGLVATLSQDEQNDNSAMVAELQSHIQEHKTFQYVIHMEMITGIELPDDPTQIPPDMQNKIAIQAAQQLQQEQQQQQEQNPPPPDPNVVMMEDIRVKEKAIDNKSVESQTRFELDHMKLQSENEHETMKLQIQMKELELAEKQLMVDEMKLNLQNEEMKLRMEVEYAKIESDKQKADLTVQSKLIDSHMRYENDHVLNERKIAFDEEKAELDAQTKAYSATLNFEKDNLAAEQEPKPQTKL